MNAKTRNIIGWIIAGLLAAFYLFMGSGKILGNEEVAANFERWGYPGWFLVLTGIFEVAGAIGVLLPKFRKWAALGLIGLMLGAAVTHLMNGEAAMLAMPLIPMVLAGVLYWLRRDDRKTA